MFLTIDQEFRDLIPKLAADERELLEKSIVSEGVREPLITWNGILIDGHNRYEIANIHGLSYKTVEKPFPSRVDVIDWMINNQLGRRNLSREQQSYLRGLQYEREKKKAFNTENLKQNTEGEKISPSVSTAKRLADQHGVTDRTIKNDAEYAKAVTAITANTAPAVKHQILNKEINITKKDTEQLAKLEPQKQREAINEASHGVPVRQWLKETMATDPVCREIDRKYDIDKKVCKILDTDDDGITDWDEAIAIHLELDDTITVEEIVRECERLIALGARIKAAAQGINRLRRVK